MNARAQLGLMAAASFVVLGGCAGIGGNKAGGSVAAAGSTGATLAAVSFAQADLNGDARIDRREFHLWLQQSADAPSARAAAGGTSEAAAFYNADRNLNGVLTLDEWQAMTERPSAGAGAAH